MLKLTYTETSFYLERLTQPLENWVQGRVIFAIRVGQRLCLEPYTASFLLPVDLPGVNTLKTQARKDDTEVLNVCSCDAEFIEVTLKGSWLSNTCETATGVFVTNMNDCTEVFLQKLWLEAQSLAVADC